MKQRRGLPVEPASVPACHPTSIGSLVSSTPHRERLLATFLTHQATRTSWLLLGLFLPGVQALAAPAVDLKPAYAPHLFTRAVQVGVLPSTNGGTPTRLYVVEQDGRVVTLDSARPQQKPALLLDVALPVRSPKDGGGSEQGLLGIAFHPSKPNVAFLNFTRQKDGATVIVRALLDGKGGGSQQPILTVEQPWANHNGGGVAFGPDGMLYVGMGDGGSAGDPRNAGQDGNTLLAKMLRLDVDNVPPGKLYGIPKDNPFLAADDGISDEIFALGLRNPWRFTFGPDGALWVGDVGQNLWEEVDIIPKGGNLGWPCLEGTHAFKALPVCKTATFVAPLAEYGHDQGQSITGGVVYTGKAIPSLVGHYLYADYVTGRVWSLSRGGTPQLLLEASANISSMGLDVDGEVLMTTHDYGGKPTGLMRLVPRP